MESLETRLRILSREIKSGSCVLALGPGASIDSSQAQEVPLSVKLANELASELEAKTSASEIGDLNRDDLRLVAQLTCDHGTELQVLQDRVCEFYKEFSGKTTDLHRKIAALPFKLCITTTPDDFLYKALEDASKRPSRAFYDFRRGQAQTLPEPTVDHPLVYHLYGHPDNPDSLVITENDLIDFLVNVVRGEPRLPSLITSQLTREESSCLFVDLGFKNWYLRVLLRALGLPAKKEKKSVALEEPEFFSQRKQHQTTVYFSSSSTIEFRPDSLNDFVTRLRTAYEELVAKSGQQPVPEPAAGAPLVFLSYASEDRELVDRLADKLKYEGIRVWQDDKNLRAGDDWHYQLMHFINNIVDYVVVVQTPAMTTRIKGVYYEEMRAALECQKRMKSGVNFVIAARTGGVDVLPELSHLHSIAVDTDAGVKELARDILDDWDARRRSQVGGPAAVSVTK
jgi:hypothetical protein